MCMLAGVSRASYYRQWQRAAPAEADTALRDRLQERALAHPRYGYRRLGALLRREGWGVNNKRVLRLTRQDNLLCLRRKAFVPVTTDSRHDWRAYPNLARRLVLSAVSQLWVADITYIRLGEQFVYLAVVLDAYSRKVVGWALANHLQASLPLAALQQALASRAVEPGLVHHSDRGVQYACGDYVSLLAQHGLVVSMSRPANPYDNAKAESFMATLKREQADARQWRTIDELRSSLTEFIDGYYNQHRLHSALGYESPVEFEARLLGAPRAALLPSPTCP